MKIRPGKPYPLGATWDGVFVVAVFVCATLRAETRRYLGKPSIVHFTEAPIAVSQATFRFVPLPPVRFLTSPSRVHPFEQFVMRGTEASPSPIASFPGVEGTGVPDTMGTVGPNHLMITLNDVFRVHDRSGGVLATMSDEDFWGTTGTTIYHYDPRVLYDTLSQRWIITEAYRDYASSNGAAGVAVAVSSSNDPGGTWSRYSMGAPPGQWYDFPMASFNQSSITVTALAVAGNNSSSTRVYVIDKASLYAGTGSFTYDYIVAQPGTMTPVSAYDPNVTTAYVIETLYGQNSVRLTRAQQGTLQQIATIAAPQTWSESTPLLSQLGSNVQISPGDTRVTNAVLRNGALWFSQTVFLPSESASRSAVQWWRVSLSGDRLDWGRIDDPSGGTSYCFPSLAVNHSNDVVIGFAQLSASSYPSGAYAFRSGSDAAGTFRSPVTLKSGLAPYADSRWGDYSATVVDPDDVTFWTLQQYAESNVSGPRWGVWWGHLPASETVATPQNLVAIANGASPVSVTWSPINAADHYEVLRSTNGGAFMTIATPPSAVFNDSGVSASTVYLYKVRAVTASGAVSGPSNPDLAATFVFTDDPVASFVTTIKSQHITQLRSSIDAVRNAAGLAAYGWSDPSLSLVRIKAAHVTELRAALDAARVALGLPTSSYSDVTLTSQVTQVRAEHVNEIRANLR